MSNMTASSPSLQVQSPGGPMGYASPTTPAQHQAQHGQGQDKPHHHQTNAAATSAAAAHHAASRQSSTSNAAARAAALAADAALWKSEAEETVKTRKNAMRVIVTKLRNFWPSHDEATLGARACELEGGVYNTTGTKQEYIARLQRDLSSLGHRKDAELKASKASLLSSGDIYAAMEKDEKGLQYPHGADARSKYVQKVLVMDKKHHGLFQLLKQVDERHKSGPENQMKQIVKTYRQLATLVDKGPYDLETLNRIDEKLDAYRQMAIVRSRQSGWNKESVDKQNDRTGQVRDMTLNKLRKINQERPLLIADLGWSLETELPNLSTPPEFSLAPAKRRPGPLTLPDPKSLSGNRRPPKAPRIPWSLQHDADVRPFVTPGMNGACVPSVRESHVKVSFAVPSARAKGYVDFDVPNDADNQETSVGNSLATHLFTMGPVHEQIEVAILSIPPSHPLCLSAKSSPGPRPGVCREFTLTQRVPTRGGGQSGEAVIHTLTISLLSKDTSDTTLPWDTRIDTLRKLPISLTVSPKTHVTDELVDSIMAMSRSSSVSEWFQAMIDGICSHLTSVERVWSEIDSVVAMYGDESLNIVVTDAPLHPIEAFVRLQSTESSNRLEASASALVNDSLGPGGPSPLGVSVTLSLKVARGLPGLTMVIGADYPRNTPVYTLVDARKGLASSQSFEKHFAQNIESTAAPHTITQVSECWYEACRVLFTSSSSSRQSSK